MGAHRFSNRRIQVFNLPSLTIKKNNPHRCYLYMVTRNSHIRLIIWLTQKRYILQGNTSICRKVIFTSGIPEKMTFGYSMKAKKSFPKMICIG
jgi:hypothetical protein